MPVVQRKQVNNHNSGATCTTITENPTEHERSDAISNGSLKLRSSVDASAASSVSKTLTWEHLPDWMKDNHFIRSGYRRQQNSWKGCFNSVFAYFHNETVNIHTHLWGAVFFLFLLFLTFAKVLSTHTSVTWKDAAGFTVFLLAAVTCLSLSALFHTGSCHSLKVAKSCVMFDYVGILVLIVGSFIPSLYYGFYCHTSYLRTYLAAIAISGLCAAFVVLNPTYNTPSYRWARTTVFIALGLTGIVPVTHAIKIYGFHVGRSEMGLDWLFGSAALYISGALLYAARFPERLFPGKLDYVGASHQIFHVHVVAAAICHYVSLYVSYNTKHGSYGGTCPVPML